ncbi:MAG: hypothetical protein RLY78_1450 [Pseudomonadota bacterium]|jgi:DNA-binding transcriptional LysR family regulator
MLQFSQLRCFVAVAGERHFGRAAARLNMTQPPLSRQIQQLEHALGLQLLERGPHGVRLTPAGRAFLPEAERLLSAAVEAELTARRALRGELGTVRVGYVGGASFALLPQLVARARQQLPGVELLLRDMSSAEQFEALRAGRLDVGLVRPPIPDAGLERQLLVREPFVAVLPADHPLAARPQLTLQDLHEQPMVMYEPAQGGRLYELISSACQTAGVAPRPAQSVRQTYALLGLVAAGVGLALLQASATRLQMDGTVIRPITLPAQVVSELHLVWRARDADEHPAIARLVALAAELASQSQAGPQAIRPGPH